MIRDNSQCEQVLYPFINGKDLNRSPAQSPSRWVVNFFDWNEEKARRYERPFDHISRKVKPERLTIRGNYQNNSSSRKNGGFTASDAKNLYHSIGRGNNLINTPKIGMKISQRWTLSSSLREWANTFPSAWFQTIWFFQTKTVIFSSSSFGLYANLVSIFHSLVGRKICVPNEAGFAIHKFRLF